MSCWKTPTQKATVNNTWYSFVANLLQQSKWNWSASREWALFFVTQIKRMLYQWFWRWNVSVHPCRAIWISTIDRIDRRFAITRANITYFSFPRRRKVIGEFVDMTIKQNINLSFALKLCECIYVIEIHLYRHTL